ncbi:uncharacterized protein sS8_0826 [Methylocaldum marinum]|uniref:VOC domain-containing protein n=1 Tax=Methylocaldum marinum TaxID=1432792 RepID=A0A250KP90_9GAMM|nr:hypothetical protein [Methylocaldum marinum]BBA32791.1 uncharacterized protein sS8_0826 [Methylocaldum marinum]
MIHHISIAARHPEHVAAVLAELLGGLSFPFPVFTGSYIAIADDPHRTAIEVYPLGTELKPGLEREPVASVDNEASSAFTATHAAISVELTEQQIKNIAARESWRAVTCNRGDLFDVVEVWVENRVLIELLTPEMANAYLKSISSRQWADFLEQNADMD